MRLLADNKETLPARAMPLAGAEEPDRALNLKGKRLPGDKRSRANGKGPRQEGLLVGSNRPSMPSSDTKSEETRPGHDMPKIKVVLSRQQGLCRDRGKPTCVRSRAEGVSSTQAKDRNDVEDPGVQVLNTKRARPMQATPKGGT